MRHILKISALARSLIAAASANAQAVQTEKNMSLELANQIASASVAACAANGYAVTATVVDRAGTVRAVQRADNAGQHTLVSCQPVKSFYLGIGQKHHAGDDGGLAKEPGCSQPGVHPRLFVAKWRCAGQGG